MVCAACYLGLSLQLPQGRLDQPGPGVFPIVVGVLLTLASLVTIWEGWQLDRREQIAMPVGSDLRRLLGLIALLFGFLIAMPIVGYIVSSALFCILLMRILSDLSWPRVLAYSLAMCAALYGAFVSFLKVPMPRGIWDFWQ